MQIMLIKFERHSHGTQVPESLFTVYARITLQGDHLYGKLGKW